jgi:hypothetical protein
LKNEELERREVAQAVCRMVSDFRRLGNRSMVDLVKASGYVQAHGIITEQLLQAHFEAEPDLIRAWLGYGYDRRTKYGYYFLGPDNTSQRGGDWVVGYYPSGNEQHFSEGSAACARFVKLEAENLRYMAEGGPPIKARR